MKNGLGKVTARIKVENWLDAELLAAGTRKEKSRSIETEALVATGAVKFYLKSSIIRQLGLRPIGEIKSRTMSNRSEPRTVFSLVSLEIQGRTGNKLVILGHLCGVSPDRLAAFYHGQENRIRKS